MRYFKKTLLSIVLVLMSQQLISQTYSTETIVISTDFGVMKVKLFNETPLHKANFLKLVNQHFYDSLLFHRVIKEFMIQGGDPDSKHADRQKLLGDGDLNYTVPAEFNPLLFHKKGMLCAARNSDEENPTRASSACQFYIVQGKPRTDEELIQLEKRINKSLINTLKDSCLNNLEHVLLKEKISEFKKQNKNDSLLFYTKQLDALIQPIYEQKNHYRISEAQKLTYKTIGGTPHLDNNYTIFGEVISGIDVIDKIAAANTNKDNRPLINLRMKIYIE